MSAIIGRFGTARVSVLAFACLVAGYAVFLRVGVSPDYPAVILPAVVLIGLAFGLGFSALSLAATAGIPDREQGLAASEFDLLKVFAQNPNRPLARDWLLETIGHREMEVFDRAMDLRITRIRRKVEKDPAHPEAIRTVRGVGYMFVPPKD